MKRLASMLTERSNTLVFKDDKDWLEALLFAVFLIAFPAAIILLWLNQGDDVPLWFAFLFTLGFGSVVPFMVLRLRDARTRELILERETGHITLQARAPFRRESRTIAPSEIKEAVFKTTDNDGEWHTACLRLAEGDVTFAQGSVHADVRDRFDTMVEELRRFRQELTITVESG